MNTFEAFNVAGITAEQAWHAIEGTRRIGEYTVVASTGTSGNRGLFIISEAERFKWLGTILAKALPDVWRTRDRVAVGTEEAHVDPESNVADTRRTCGCRIQRAAK